MREHLKTEWRQFLASPPGARFLQCYERHQKRNAPWLKPLMFFAGVFSFVIGFVLAFIPGPAILFFAISAALFACEYRPVANAFDKVEVWGRGVWARFRGRRPRKQSRMETTAGTLSEEERETLRAAAEASIQQRLAAASQPTAAAPGGVDMRNLQVPGAPPPPSAIEFNRPAPAPAAAGPVDMSKLRIPLNGTREIHAQAVAQASVEKYRAGAEPQPAAAEPVDAYMENEVAPSDASQRQPDATPEQSSPSQWSVQSAVPPRRSERRGPEPLFSSQRDAKAAQTPHFSSTKQGTGPDQPRVVAIVPHVSRPPMQRAGTMRIWAEVTKPSPTPDAVKNVKRVIQQSAKNDASVVTLAPPAIIGDRATRRHQRAAGHG